MTSSIKAVTMPKPSDYGAAELKKFIKKYTFRGFIITVSLVILFFLIYFASGMLKSTTTEGVKLAPIAKFRLDELPPPESGAEDIPPPPPTQQIINTGPASRAGIPIPVPEALIKEDLKEFATTKELHRASAEGGSGIDIGTFASNIDWEGTKVQHREKEPEPDEFIPVEKEPSLDYEKLKKSVVYPEIARRAGIEGKVIVRVLVGANGEVRRTIIEYSDSELLNDAAVQAIKKATFTPGIQNGQPITCWVSVPITFQLR